MIESLLTRLAAQGNPFTIAHVADAVSSVVNDMLPPVGFLFPFVTAILVISGFVAFGLSKRT